MVKTFSDIFTEDVAKFCDTLNPIQKPNTDELFNVHEDDEVDIPEIPEKPEKPDTPSDEQETQSQSPILSDDDINRIAQAILKMQEKEKEV